MAVDASDHKARVATRPQLIGRIARGSLGETWAGQFDDGRRVAAKRIVARDELTRDLLVAGVRNLTGLDHPALVPVRGAFVEDQVVWVLTDLGDGISLRRLLSVARLTTAQATTIALAVLDGLETLHTHRIAHGALHAGNVLISADGVVRLTDFGLSPEFVDAAEPDSVDRAAVGTLLRDALGITQPLSRADQPHEGTMAIRNQLAALVARIGGEGWTLRRTASPVVASPAGPAVQLAPVAARPVKPMLLAATAAALVTVIVAVATGWELTPHRLTARPAQVGTAGGVAAGHPAAVPSHAASARPSATQPPTTPRPAARSPLAVPVLAAASGGDITSVDLTVAVGQCLPGSTCKLGVYVNLAPRTADEEVDWTLVFYDRCTGQSTQQPGLSVVAIPDWAFVFRRQWVTMPQSPSVAVIALTSRPVPAASRPLLVGQASSC